MTVADLGCYYEMELGADLHYLNVDHSEVEKTVVAVLE